MEARVGVLPSSSVGTVSDAILQRDGEGCRSMELGWHGEYAKDNQPIARPEDPADYSRDSDDELPDLRHAILMTCPPIAVVPATGLVM